MESIKRVGIVIGTKPDMMGLYRRVHRHDSGGVRDLLCKYNIHNFSIFIRRLDDGQEYLFGYYEYTGCDYDADMARLAAEPRNKEWLLMCDPCQIPLKGEKTWAVMEEIYHND